MQSTLRPLLPRNLRKPHPIALPAPIPPPQRPFSSTPTPLKQKRRKEPTRRVFDKTGREIQLQDVVLTPTQRGWHEGAVQDIVRTKHEAGRMGLGRAPKVLFRDQNGKDCAIAPSYLRIVESKGVER